METFQTRNACLTTPFQAMDITIAAVNLGGLVESVAHHRGRIELTRDGETTCVLISKSELAAIESALQILAEHPATAHLRDKVAAIAALDVAGYHAAPQLADYATLSAVTHCVSR